LESSSTPTSHRSNKHEIYALRCAFCLLFASVSIAQSDEINVIPKPQSRLSRQRHVYARKKTKILAISDAGAEDGAILTSFCRETTDSSSKRPIAGDEERHPICHTRDERTSAEFPEGYSLNISPDLIQISGEETRRILRVAIANAASPRQI